MTDADLISFLEAQDQIYDQVVDELAQGRKKTHWMWFIFRQLAGLGRSAIAQQYAIRDLNQARRYIAHPVLGTRLRQVVNLMLRHTGKSALEILGSPDDLTLFREAAVDDADRALFVKALDRFYRGDPDETHA
jgi:uncharacterized protein (DUF1810 family)